MGLLPLEFTDCLTDSPYFRENLHAHEKELEKTSLAIKQLIKEVKDLVNAARGTAQSGTGLTWQPRDTPCQSGRLGRVHSPFPGSRGDGRQGDASCTVTAREQCYLKRPIAGN